ncbi:hypothetical protein CFC21_043013 [Triticum aestivum]|uniref:Uncharacterized protein n=3 Tax=Triticum TaxID=4564 RepID=A0A9R1JW42_WHEAT|nr:uncharacterized protein LOC123071515 [Triticum aestivum]KAF7031730.1 hypothetical protein CFC21_043013 [Triticum aestivum]CDM85121.1 unnamed protein product [Triticum aestivum]VAH82117.1 unnamed protein product [Triticum turgidum subsp. durum]
MEGAPRANTRRRRLVERGSDRLAFITGQTRDLPPDPDPYPDSPVAEPRLQPKHKSHSSEGDLLHKFNASSAASEIQPVYEPPLLRSRDDETLNKRTYDYGAASVQPKRDMEMRPKSVPPRDMDTRPRSAPPSQPNQADYSSWSLETLKQLVDFTPQEITQAISATELNRCLASILIAFIVVVSNWGLDVGGTITRVLVCTRPLLFLIITNVTIVMSLLMENRDPNARGRQAGISLGSDGLGLMLELGMLLQKASEAMLMDFSICAVIMICFL